MTYYLACDSCKKMLWVGQQGAGSKHPWIYRGPTELDKLETFLNAHTDHPLVFTHEYVFEGTKDGYEEV